MRFMILMKANQQSEAGELPSEGLLAAMGKFNEELVNAGMMMAGEGLQPSSKGARVQFDASGKPSVQHGPFPANGEMVAGFWIWKTRSLEEAIEWVKRVPTQKGVTSQIEIRQIFEAEDFAASDPTGELRAAEEKLRARTAAQR